MYVEITALSLQTDFNTIHYELRFVFNDVISLNWGALERVQLKPAARYN